MQSRSDPGMIDLSAADWSVSGSSRSSPPAGLKAEGRACHAESSPRGASRPRHLFVAIDRTSKFAFARLEDKANRVTATAFLEALIDVVPYKIRHGGPGLRRDARAGRGFTDNGVQFCYQPSRRNGPTARYFRHMVDMRCQENGIEHRLTTCRTYQKIPLALTGASTHATALDAYNHAKRLKTLKGLTPNEFIGKTWTEEPERFIVDPTHYTLGLNT